MKKLLYIFILLTFIFGANHVFARDNKVIQYKTNNISNKVEVSVEDKYKNEQKKEKDVLNSEQAKKEKREELQKQIKEKQKEIIAVQKSRGSARAIENRVNQLKNDIKTLQKELNSIK